MLLFLIDDLHSNKPFTLHSVLYARIYQVVFFVITTHKLFLVNVRHFHEIKIIKTTNDWKTGSTLFVDKNYNENPSVSKFRTSGSMSPVVLGDTENFFHDIYREKVSRYCVYHDTCFASGVIEGEESGGRGQLRGAVCPGCSAAGNWGVIIIILHFIKVNSINLGPHHGPAQNFGRRLRRFVGIWE